MIQGHEDLFVGLVAVGLGVFLLAAAVVNWKWFYTLPSAAFLSRHLGRTGARLVHVCLGITLIALGFTVAQRVRFPIL